MVGNFKGPGSQEDSNHSEASAHTDDAFEPVGIKRDGWFQKPDKSWHRIPIIQQGWKQKPKSEEEAPK